MPRRKQPYYDLVNHLEQERGLLESEAKANATEVYSKWIEDESVNIIDLWKSLNEKALVEESSPVEEVKGESKTMIVDSEKPSKFDWKKYLEDNPQFIALNKGMAKAYGKIDSEKISKKQEQEILKVVDDKLKIVLLQFFKDITHEQGFASIQYDSIGPANEGYAGVVCSIQWSNGQITSGIGDAHYNNATSFTKYYCGPMAENRSFVRAVKSFFNIPLLGADEIGETPKEEEKPDAPTGPHTVLKKAAKNKLGVTSFEAFKEYLKGQIKKSPNDPWIKPEEYSAWGEYEDWSDIAKSKIAELVKKIKGL